MSRRKRQNHSPAFKAQVALTALKGDKTLAELAQQFDLHPNQITDWKGQLQERAAHVFGDGAGKAEVEPDLQVLHAKIGRLTLENFFVRRAHQDGAAERKKMIDRTHDLPVAQQCRILHLARSTAYYTPRPVSEADLALMRHLDELHLAYPFAGARMLRDFLRLEGHSRLGRRHVGTLMARIGIEPLYRKPNTSRLKVALQKGMSSSMSPKPPPVAPPEAPPPDGLPRGALSIGGAS